MLRAKQKNVELKYTKSVRERESEEKKRLFSFSLFFFSFLMLNDKVQWFVVSALEYTVHY